ncbi:MAG TPA: tetratricopeptide repeat protein [Chthoniobacterales bacterium]|nr:tetratricopeptide repeat protein [Chthoniobacterales bacterium]
MPTRGDMHFYNDWANQILHGQFTQSLAFYGLPGYAYLLAFLGRLFGQNPFIPGLLQAVLDAGTAVLIYRIFATIFDSRASESSARVAASTFAVLAAIGWGFFVPAEAYSIVLMPTALFVFVFWFVIWRLVRQPGGPTGSELLFLALLVGLTATTVATILALVPLMIAAAIFRQTSIAWPKFAAQIGVLVVGLVIGTSPCWVHNYFVAKDPVVLSAHSGINFWIGNNPDANGYPRFPPGLRAGPAAMLQDSIDQAELNAGRPLKHAEVSRFWSDKAKNFIVTRFADWLKLIARKLRNFWSAFQYDDLSVITILREQGVIFPGIYFGVIAALAIPGILVSWRVAPNSRWVLGAIVLAMLSVLTVFVTERYRLVVVPGLLIFAALGLSLIWRKIIAGGFRIVVLYLIVLLASARFVSWPQRDPSLWALDAYNAGWQALESNNLPLAENKLAIAYAYVPDNSETLFALGNLRLAQKNSDDAAKFYQAVLALDPKHKGAFNNLGVIAFDAAEFDNAENWFSRAEQVDPRNPKTHFMLARVFLGKNDPNSAKTEIATAIQLKPDQPEFIALRNQIEQNSR